MSVKDDIRLVGFEAEYTSGANPGDAKWCTGWRCPKCSAKGRIVYALAKVQRQTAEQHAEWIVRQVWDAHAAAVRTCPNRNQSMSKPYLAEFPTHRAWVAAGRPDRPTIAAPVTLHGDDLT